MLPSQCVVLGRDSELTTNAQLVLHQYGTSHGIIRCWACINIRYLFADMCALRTTKEVGHAQFLSASLMNVGSQRVTIFYIKRVD